jgi:tetratricopeptide (TPR) repeat protein
VRWFAALLVVLLAVGPAAGQNPAAAARDTLARWHEDPARLDRARDTLEAAVAASPAPETLVELARVWFTIGEFRARTDKDRLAAYERGSEAARRAVAAAPRSEQAHLWYAINLGRLAELRGIVRAAGLLSTIRAESETVLKLNPSSVDGLILAAGLAAEVPGFLGGDRARAETLFKRALATDPHQTGGRLELARLYMSTRRWNEARRELQRILDERTPSDVPRWTLRDRPRAQALLTELYQSGRVTIPPESP